MSRPCWITNRMHNRRCRTQRRATTLVEMVVVISLLSLAMSTMGMLLHGVWQVQHAMDEHRLTLDTLQRLATQFRSDVHSAASAAIRMGGEGGAANSASNSSGESIAAIASATAAEASTASGATEPSTASQSNDASPRQSFTLTLPDRKQIDYQVSAGSVSRTLRDGEKVLARESYVLRTNAVVKWEITSSDFNRQQSPWQASLLISYPRSNHLPEFSERRELRIDAVAGLQMREMRLNGNVP